MENATAMEQLILQGAIEPAGIDLETGEFLYTFTEKLMDIDHDLHREVNNYIYGGIDLVWEKGFIDMQFDEDNPTITLTEKAYDPSSIDAELDDREKSILNNIIRMLDS